uniref:Egg protein CP391S-like protein n=1 Tax=Schistosoma mansoni TaxID=6183 RepID=A0AA82N7T3_SCHMA
MRYNFSLSLWMLIYVIFVWSYKRFNCNDYCKRPDLFSYEVVIIENDTYRYSIHYNYSMRIQRNQSQPVPSERFNKKEVGIYKAHPQFSFSYYGYHVKEVRFYEHDTDGVHVYESNQIGYINNYIKNYKKSESRVLNEKVTITMTTLIHPNGMVSFYYDNVKICSQYNTSETCQRATTLSMTCFWCKKGKKCIESNDQNTHGLKVNDCSVEKKSDVNDLNSSTTMEHSETTSGITEVQVSENLMKTTEETDKQSYMTTRTTEENKQDKSHWYLYVVIPLVASLFLICIGCIIWRWLLRRKRSNE